MNRMPVLRRFGWTICLSLIVLTFFRQPAVAVEIAAGPKGFASNVKPFSTKHCIKCHGPEKQKADLALHTIRGDLSRESALELWESILERLENGEMPPEGEPQPSDKDRAAVVEWIESALQDSVNARPTQTPLARRLTNFEYENTIRDLLGFELKLIDSLPKDPVKPYRFNNTAEFMRMGPEQVDRYLECARRAMASAIVDPAKPEIHKSRREWKAYGLDRGLGADEISPWGNRRNTPAWDVAC